MTENKGSATLVRGLSLTQATAINMIDMVGIGPFITLPIIAGVMHGPAGIFAWLLGALLAFMDGLVWAELGAAWPEAGGRAPSRLKTAAIKRFPNDSHKPICDSVGSI